MKTHIRFLVGLIRIYTPGKAVVLSGAFKNQSAKQCIKTSLKASKSFKIDLIFRDFPKASHDIYLTCGLQGVPGRNTTH